MANVEINVGLQVTKQTPINKGDFEQLIFAQGETDYYAMSSQVPLLMAEGCEGSG